LASRAVPSWDTPALTTILAALSPRDLTPGRSGPERGWLERLLAAAKAHPDPEYSFFASRTIDIDSAVLAALDRAGHVGLPRTSLRGILRVRNQSLREALTGLAASRRIAPQGETWIRLPVPVPVPAPAHTDTRRNGNAVAS